MDIELPAGFEPFELAWLINGSPFDEERDDKDDE